MIKKLQRKFIVIVMGSLLFVMLLLVGLINVFSFYYMTVRINGTINSIISHQGKIPEFKKGDALKELPGFGFQMNPETKFVTRYFLIEMNEDDSIKNTDTSHINAISSADAQDYAKKAMSSGKASGFYGIYKFSVIDQPEGYMLIFLDCRNELQMVKQVFMISCIVSLGTLLLMFILVSVFSRKAIKPLIESTEKQKLFITDAGHEIKTPLAIISANADVLELMGGENEWITSIRNQTVRLDKLVKNLLTLSKMEEDNVKISFGEFDLSETVERMAAPFSAVADTMKKTFVREIAPDKKMYGDQSSIEQLVSTLVDNALKYSDEGGTIKISLSGSKKGIKLEVFNTTGKIDTKNLDKLFDRFYRSDSSRARETGGYGIGLSIAKSIVEAHHGKISVKSDDGKSIRFTVML
jgi:Signal transduction histidine kinase